jgi:hypothetical protein
MSRRPRGLKATLWARATDAAGVTVPCAFCPKLLTLAEATVDHEPALAVGGKPRQAVLACDACNQRRSKVTNAIVNARRKQQARRKRKSK